MLKNYLTVALRTIKREKGYTAINVFGLSVGVGACILIVLFIQHSLSFDRFHDRADRIYRVVSSEGGDTGHDEHMPVPLAPALKNGLPEVYEAVRFARMSGNLILRDRDDESLSRYEDGFVFADSTFFEVFSFPLRKGDPETALDRPFDVVITERIAERYFGDEDPIGKTLSLDNSFDLTVTGVARDVPPNSSIRFDFLSSLTTFGRIQPWFFTNGWNATASPTYVLLRKGADAESVESKIPPLLARHTDQRFVLDLHYELEPLTDVRLHSKASNQLGPQFDPVYLRIFAVIAVLILAIACINYTNLAVAQATRRSREVGVRKSVGAKRKQLAIQFLSEATLMSLLGVAGALLLTRLLLPVFSSVIHQEITLEVPWSTSLCVLAGLVMIVGLLAGSYPAFLFARTRPVEILKGSYAALPAGSAVRKGLVVFQFIISIALIICTLTIQNQLDYVRDERLGVDAEQMLVIPLQTVRSAPSPVVEQEEAFRSEVRQLAGVEEISFASSVPTRPASRFSVQRTDTGNPFLFHSYMVDSLFLEALGIDLAAGSHFAVARPASGRSVIVNQAAVDALGWGDDATAIGRELPLRIGREQPDVVGVIRDFHFESLHRPVAPVVIQPLGDRSPGYAILRLSSADLPSILLDLEGIWESFSPQHPFDFFFLDDAYDRLYQAEDRLARIFNAFSVIAIVVACLGLFGLATYASQQRTKEIGIRKVLGATASSIVVLLSGQFVRLVSLAYIIAAPVAFVVMNRWLETFAYRTQVDMLIFAAAAAAAFGLTILTVGSQALRAASLDPVHSLRYE